MNDTYGRTSGMPLAQYDHEQRCWRTSEATSLWALPMSSLTLPTWGCLRDGVLYELPRPALPIVEPDCSSLPTPRSQMSEASMESQRRMVANNGYKARLEEWVAMLPTPMADNSRGLPNGGDYQSLPNAVLTLPTPRAANGEPRNQTIYPRAGVTGWQGSRLNLENALALLPTPAVNDMGAGKDPDAWQEWAARQKASDGRPAPHGKSLEQEALSLGASTGQPLSAGQTSWDDLLQPLPFDETTGTD